MESSTTSICPGSNRMTRLNSHEEVGWDGQSSFEQPVGDLQAASDFVVDIRGPIDHC